LTDINKKLTILANLVAAQGERVTTIKELHEDVKTLTAEFIALRSDLAHNTNLLEILLSRTSLESPRTQANEQTNILPTEKPSEGESNGKAEYGTYFDDHVAKNKWAGLTRELFISLGVAKDAYTKMIKLFPHMLLGKEVFKGFRTGEFTFNDLSGLNREIIRLSSSLHKESYDGHVRPKHVVRRKGDNNELHCIWKYIV
jgi:hypothetical protein